MISLEELIETERQALNSSNCTKLTLETFLQWKKRKLKEKKEAKEKEEEKKRLNFKAGHHIGVSDFTYCGWCTFVMARKINGVSLFSVIGS